MEKCYVDINSVFFLLMMCILTSYFSLQNNFKNWAYLNGNSL